MSICPCVRFEEGVREEGVRAGTLPDLRENQGRFVENGARQRKGWRIDQSRVGVARNGTGGGWISLALKHLTRGGEGLVYCISGREGGSFQREGGKEKGPLSTPHADVCWREGEPSCATRGGGVEGGSDLPGWEGKKSVVSDYLEKSPQKV